MKFSRTTYLLSLILGCILFVPVSLTAQVSHTTASNMALGSGGTAYLDSYHANFVNPANLMLNPYKPDISVGVLGGFSTTAGGSLINISVYNDYFTTGQTVSGQIATDALDQWFGTDPGNMRNAGMQLDIIPLGVSYQTDKWAASAAFRSRVLANGATSRGFAELGIHGLDSEVFSSPRPVNFTMESMAFHEISLGYSRELLNLPNLLGFAENLRVYGGIAPKLLLGTQASRLNFDSNLLLEGENSNEVDLIRHDFAYQLETTGSLSDQLTNYYNDKQSSDELPDINNYVEPEAGDFSQIRASGFGVDLGGTAVMDIDVPYFGDFFSGSEQLTVGLSLTDLGQLSYKDEIARFTAEDILEWEGFEFDQDKLEDDFDGSREDYMESVLKDSIATEVYGSFAPENVNQISRALPSRLNFGTQLVMNNLSVSLDLSKGFLEQGTNSKRISVSTGLEYRLIGIIPLRVGIRTGGQTSTSFSAGLGVDLQNFEFSVGGLTVPNSAARGSSAGAAWSGFVVRF